MSNDFTFLLHCKGTTIISFCKEKRREMRQNSKLVDLCQGVNTILT